LASNLVFATRPLGLSLSKIIICRAYCLVISKNNKLSFILYEYRRAYSLSKPLLYCNHLDSFTSPIPFAYTSRLNKPYLVNLSLDQLYNYVIFSVKVGNVLPIDTKFLVYIKMRYHSDSFYMCGSQFGFSSCCDISEHFDIVNARVIESFTSYNLVDDDLDYIQLSFTHLDVKILSDFYMDKSNFYKDNSASEIRKINSIISIPVSISEYSLGEPLKVSLHKDNNITNIYLYTKNTAINFMDRIKAINFMDRIKAIAKLLPASSKHKNMLLGSRYKFYHISEKLISAIYAIKRLVDGSVDKIRYSLNGVIM